jgi:FkbM family methyltransferase
MERISLLLIRIGRWIAKRSGLENNQFILNIYRFVVKGLTTQSGLRKIKTFGVEIFVDASDHSMVPGLLNGTYEKHEIAWLRKNLKAGDVFIDVGANVGLYSNIASKIVGKNGIVIAIEATPSTAEILKQNLTLNESTNVEVVQAAATNRAGVVQIYTSGLIGCNSIVSKPELQDFETVDVEARTLNEIILSRKLNKVSMIKLDIEGAEMATLEGADEILKRYNPKLLLEFNASFLRANKFDPEILLNRLHGMFESVRFVREKDGALMSANTLADISGQIIANLVLEEYRGRSKDVPYKFDDGLAPTLN